MNCRQAQRLLPLWIGRDLADASESDDLRGHLAICPDCTARLQVFQESLEALQSVSTAARPLATRCSLWPQLSMVLIEMPRRRDHFNGWIPAAAMTIAASLMVAVSVVQVQREMGDASSTAWNLPSAERPGDRNSFRDDERLPPHLRPQDSQTRHLVNW